MLSNHQTQSFQIEVKSSKIEIFFICIIHVLAVFSCFLAAVPMVIIVVLSIGILLHLVFSLYQKGKLIGLKLQYSSSQAWQLAMVDADFSLIQILASTVITPLVIILHYKKQSCKKQSMLIFNDAVSPEAFRKLTVELRINNLN